MLDALQRFLEVALIDITMSGDNAVVIGLAVAGIAAHERKRIVALGIVAATFLRIVLALIAVPLLKVLGLTVAGGLLLLWVAWEFYRELHTEEEQRELAEPKTRLAALSQIILADVSMSLDNVLAVAGAARDHVYTLVFGLIFSIALMAVASTFIAKMISTNRWIGYIGLCVVVYVALQMIVEGTFQIVHAGLLH